MFCNVRADVDTWEHAQCNQSPLSSMIHHHLSLPIEIKKRKINFIFVTHLRFQTVQTLSCFERKREFIDKTKLLGWALEKGSNIDRQISIGTMKDSRIFHLENAQPLNGGHLLLARPTRMGTQKANATSRSSILNIIHILFYNYKKILLILIKLLV